jgi:hypothetical protein
MLYNSLYRLTQQMPTRPLTACSHAQATNTPIAVRLDACDKLTMTSHGREYSSKLQSPAVQQTAVQASGGAAAGSADASVGACAVEASYRPETTLA